MRFMFFWIIGMWVFVCMWGYLIEQSNMKVLGRGGVIIMAGRPGRSDFDPWTR